VSAEDIGLVYIRGHYQVPARKGARIRFDYPKGTRRRGTIVGSSDAHLLVDFGNGVPLVLHPTWQVTYLDGAS
jgi:hypothetical protein